MVTVMIVGFDPHQDGLCKTRHAVTPGKLQEGVWTGHTLCRADGIHLLMTVGGPMSFDPLDSFACPECVAVLAVQSG